MTAADHLNVHQWPVEKVGQLRAGNRPGMSVAEEYEANKRGEYTEDAHEHAQHYGYAGPREYQEALNQHVASNGIARHSYWSPGEEGLGEDPHDKFLVNGAHRYAAAMDNGIHEMPMAEYPKGALSGSAKLERVPGWNGAR